MAASRRAERERLAGASSTETSGTAGSVAESEGNKQQQPNLPSENRIPVVEPTAATSSTSTATNSSSPRGRSSRTRNSESAERRRERRAENSEKSKEGIAVLLAGIHSFGAKLVNECIELDEQEANQMADAIHRVNELYDGGFVSPKLAAWGNLAMCFGQIYVPRAMVLMKIGKKKSPQIVQKTLETQKGIN